MMSVAELWRYPVKSLAGERLARVQVTANGMAGDRVVQVTDGRGRLVTARTTPRLLGLAASLGPGGEPYVNGAPWTSPAAIGAIQAAAGADAKLVGYDGRERFDVLPLLIATDGALTAFGRDRRRLRPNLVVDGVPGLAEREWPHSGLRIGEVLIGIRSLRARCVMTTWDPDTQASDLGVLADIHHRFGGRLALDAWVVVGGTLRVGDPVERIAAPEEPAAVALHGRYWG